MEQKPLPIGVDIFKQLITEGYYYIDKTLLIKDLLDNKGKVNLFTRPRRFGKTLNISMLQYFFEDMYDKKGNKKDYSYLFDGLKILDAGEKYTKHMGKYPVINLTLKSGKQKNFEMAYALLCNQIAREYIRHAYVLDSLDERPKEIYKRIMDEEASYIEYANSLLFLSECLKDYFDMDVIILIDEYDVPLENAFARGFYEEMSDFIRSLFESALKTNDNLSFAVLTGCLRVSKESIFTGLNNLKIYSILSESYGEYFGFTHEEVKKLCDDYGLSANYPQLKDWYDGYMFGETDVYNPWSTLMYIDDHRKCPQKFPIAYWANTSSNSIVRTLVERATSPVKRQIEYLLSGGEIEKPIHDDVTYDEIFDTDDNLWNFMFFTGYFKKTGERFDEVNHYVSLKIPNKEVYYIFENKIQSWFLEKVKSKSRQTLFDAIISGNTEVMEAEITKTLYDTISYFDYSESYYHGFLTGLLYGIGEYGVKSNREGGTGRTDLFLFPPHPGMKAFVFEFKISNKESDIDKMANEALAQIETNEYYNGLFEMGYNDVISYGICFYKKSCTVKRADVALTQE